MSAMVITLCMVAASLEFQAEEFCQPLGGFKVQAPVAVDKAGQLRGTYAALLGNDRQRSPIVLYRGFQLVADLTHTLNYTLPLDNVKWQCRKSQVRIRCA